MQIGTLSEFSWQSEEGRMKKSIPNKIHIAWGSSEPELNSAAPIIPRKNHVREKTISDPQPSEYGKCCVLQVRLWPQGFHASQFDHTQTLPVLSSPIPCANLQRRLSIRKLNKELLLEKK